MGCGHGRTVALEWGIAPEPAGGDCGCGGGGDSLEKRVARVRAQTAKVKSGELLPRELVDIAVALTGTSRDTLRRSARRFGGAYSTEQVEVGLQDAVAVGILTEEEAGTVGSSGWFFGNLIGCVPIIIFDPPEEIDPPDIGDSIEGWWHGCGLANLDDLVACKRQCESRGQCTGDVNMVWDSTLKRCRAECNCQPCPDVPPPPERQVLES